MNTVNNVVIQIGQSKTSNLEVLIIATFQGAKYFCRSGNYEWTPIPQVDYKNFLPFTGRVF